MKPANPVLVELVRGSVVESRHRGSIAVCDAKGKLLVDSARTMLAHVRNE